MSTIPTDDAPRNEGIIDRYYHRNPYVALAAAAGVGYVVAGGVLTPFTRRLFKMGVRALVIPLAAQQIKNMSQGPSDVL